MGSDQLCLHNPLYTMHNKTIVVLLLYHDGTSQMQQQSKYVVFCRLGRLSHMEPIICIFSKKMMIIIFCFYYGKNKTKNDIVFFLELYQQVKIFDSSVFRLISFPKKETNIEMCIQIIQIAYLYVHHFCDFEIHSRKWRLKEIFWSMIHSISLQHKTVILEKLIMIFQFIGR